MATLTGTKVVHSEMSGDLKWVVYTGTLEAATDTITFVAATHKFRKIYAVIPLLQAGQDSLLLTLTATFSGLVVTLKSYNPEGTAATDWTGATFRLVMLVGSAD